MIRPVLAVVLAVVLLTGCRVGDTTVPATTTAPPPVPAPSAPALPLDLPLGDVGSGLDGAP